MGSAFGLAGVAGCGTWKDRAAWRPSVRWRGFNLLGMFRKKILSETIASDPTWSRTPGFFREEEFAWTHEWGFNFVRLPLDYRIWIRNNDWNDIDEAALKPLDAAVEYGRKYGLHVQICLHRAPGFCINKPAEPKDLFRDEEAFAAMAKHWRLFARRYRGIPNETLSFDLLNEPHLHSEAEIAKTFVRLIDVIRAEDPERFIIANGWGCGRHPIRGLWGMKNVGQSMRGYDPSTLSHYKAEWWTPPPSEKPVWPPKGAASGRAWLEKNVFADWIEAQKRGEFVISNEFACYRLTPHEIALAWLEDYLKIWKARNIGWAMWNLCGRFGVMDSDRPDVAYEDFQGHKLDRRMLELLRRY